MKDAKAMSKGNAIGVVLVVMCELYFLRNMGLEWAGLDELIYW